MSARTPEIDLHPQAMPGQGPEQALAACRHFLETTHAAGHAEVRIITGLGLHGDGTPRLRLRVEREVLSAMAMRIIATHYEQNGAVIRVEFNKTAAKPSARHLRALKQQATLHQRIQLEERLLVAWDRLDAAWEALDHGDLRRAKLKANQLMREFFTARPALTEDQDALEIFLKDIEKKLHEGD